MNFMLAFSPGIWYSIGIFKRKEKYMTIHFCKTQFEKSEMWKIAAKNPSPEIPNDVWICRNGNGFSVLDNKSGTLYLAEFREILDALNFGLSDGDFSTPEDCKDTKPWQIAKYLA